MDFFIEMGNENAEKIVRVIKEFTGSSIGFVKEDFLKEDNVIMLGRTPFRIDILTSISGVSFEDAYQSSHIYTNDGIDIRCIHINELIANKKSTGRLKDLADAEMLEKILKKRQNNK
ncbi:MAG: hypothetical protein ABJB11_10245 [Ferruginibacter sp.]